MKTQSIDTSPDAERVLIEMIRKAPVTRRFNFVQSWSYSMIEAGRINVHQLHSQATEQEIQLLYAERCYGKELVDELRAALYERGIHPSGIPDFQAALLPLIEVLAQLHIAWALTGSLASSLYGMQRATMQLDLIAALRPQDGQALSRQLTSSYYFREDEVKTALEQETSLTLIHLESLLSAVITLPKSRTFDRDMLRRAHSLVLVEGGLSIPVVSPEDIAVLQLEQFKSSGERADDIWYDLLGLLKVQGPSLNLVTLERQAAVLDITPLLMQALVDAGLREA